MCGRFTLTQNLRQVEQHFGVKVAQADEYHPTYNAAPTQYLPVITNLQSDTLQFFRWGLIPHWAKEASMGNKMINARAETLTEKPSFKKLVTQKRCLVISDGFYEWQSLEGPAQGSLTSRKRKQPYHISLASNGLFAFAGLWENWIDRNSGEVIPSFSIITTEANALVKEVHDRMPVILSHADEALWLKDSISESDHLDLLKPYPAEKMKKYAVGEEVNSPRNNSPDLLHRLNMQ
ncbi:MAG: SOS response-associated peptidase [Bacteroidota bacterium]